MSYYKVILVDDEEDVRQAIAEKLDWPSLGFEVSGEASNGEEALELCEALEPDVVLTDIRMPFMDGLEFCKRLKQVHPGVKILIFSGYDDFEYAKQAIQLEVEEYILKPIDADELAAVFSRMKNVLDKEILQKRDVQRLRAYYEQSLPMMRQQFITSLLESGMETELLEWGIEEYGIQKSSCGYCVALIKVAEEKEARSSIQDTGHAQYMRLSAQEIIKETIGGELDIQIVSLPDSIAVLITLKPNQDAKSIASRLNILLPVSKKLLNLTLCIGLGKVYPSLEEISESAREASDALQYRRMMETGQCIYIGDIEPGSPIYTGGESRQIDTIVRKIKIGTEEELEDSIFSLLRHIKQSGLGMAQYRLFVLEITAELMRLARAYRLDETGDETLDELLARSVSRFDDLDSLGKWMLELCKRLHSLIRRERKDSGRRTIEKAIEHINLNYNDCNLSVDSMSGVLNLSPAYFSTLFKKETGHGFVGYLTRLRMEKALEYLNTTDDKTYVIAEKVGYSDPNYFSYVFKRQYGVSPSKYRTDRMKQDEPHKKPADHNTQVL